MGKSDKTNNPISNSKLLLQKFINKSNYNRDIYHDLMPYKVKEILLVSSLYDAYNIEKEGRFTEYVLGEYHQMNLTASPRITGVTTIEETFDQLHSRHFDFIIIMMGVEKRKSLELCKTIKKAYPDIPIFILMNSNKDIGYFREHKEDLTDIDKIFVWKGDSRIFVTMIKLLEDKRNVANDTKIGMVRVMLLVEDSPKYYSLYLPVLYKLVMEQTQRIINDVSTDELYKVLRMRARPKILHASSYEEATSIIEEYKDFLLCLLSDVEFEQNGKLDSNAGINLLKFAQEKCRELPTVLQSSDAVNSEIAGSLGSFFINKGSDTIIQDFKNFISQYLGFGNFVYRDKNGKQIAVASTLKEFENTLHTLPDESLIYHAKKDQFSLWLMARGEIQTAKILNPAKVTDFSSPQKLREYLIDIIRKFRGEQRTGKVIPFEEKAILNEHNIVNLVGGSYGGKGRGLAFLNTLINNFDFSQYVQDIRIRTPKTSIVGTYEFENFLETNKLWDEINKSSDHDNLKKLFLKGDLSSSLIEKLKVIISSINNPLAIRSSGMFEDSLAQPFAGIFETYLLPNNNPDPKTRLQQLMNAIKLVYASVYSEAARDYIEAINLLIEEERMAIVIQEVVGNRYEDVFYPHISGVAQSYNYYSYANMKPEDGFAVVALGLGKFVAEGERAFRFSPKYPSIDINTAQTLYRNSQTDFFAVDLDKKNIDLMEGETAGLIRLDIEKAEKHNTLKHLASVYDIDDDRIIPGLTTVGPRVVNFANILKYNYIPLAKTIEAVLDVVKEAFGSPVEIEFAVDLKKDEEGKASFYLLQIKPLLGSTNDYEIDINNLVKENMLLYSDKCMGNGMIRDIQDVIFVDNESFDKKETLEMTYEIERINEKMKSENKEYVLIGPGRWGTRDRWIGIPVKWTQISNAKVIVETSLKDYPLDASWGSHFFHNVTAMNVGYFSVHHNAKDNFINWDVINSQELIDSSKYFKHVRFKDSLSIKMDGKKRVSLINWK